MRAAILLFLLPATTIAASVPPIPMARMPTPVIGRNAPQCPDEALRHATGNRLPGPQKLGDLPPANLYLAVDRSIGGCRRPIIVSTGIGNR